MENSEPALHAVLEMLATKQTRAQIEGRLADVRDRERIFRLIADFKPDIVFHAAALKHVPLLERDWGEGGQDQRVRLGQCRRCRGRRRRRRPW